MDNASLNKSLGVLNSYQFVPDKGNRQKNDKLLGVQKIGDKSHLVIVTKKDVNTFNLFLRFFGAGPLKNTHISIKSIGDHTKTLLNEIKLLELDKSIGKIDKEIDILLTDKVKTTAALILIKQLKKEFPEKSNKISSNPHALDIDKF